MQAFAVRHRPTRDYIPVNCSCGRQLRAKTEFAGGSIRCWDCREEVRVPAQRRPLLVIGLMREGARHAVEAREFALMVGGAILFSVLLAFGKLGLIPAFGLLAYGAYKHGESYRRASGFDSEETPTSRRWEIGFCLASALLPTLPWLLKPSTGDLIPTLGTASLIGLAIGLVALPLISLGIFNRDGNENGLRLVGRTAARHPFATTLALLILPAALLVSEGLLTVVTKYQGTYGLMVIDQLPKPEGVTNFVEYTLFSEMDLRVVPMSRFDDVHLETLAKGGSLTLGLLSGEAWSRPSFIDPLWVVPWTGGYACLKIFYTTLFGLVMLTALAIQSKWLGLLSTLQTRRPAA